MAPRNRIVGKVDMPISDINFHPLNYKEHPRAQKDILIQILGEIGWVDGVIVNQNTNNLIDGEARVQTAIGRGEETVPVTLVDLTEEEELMALGTIDPIGAQALVDDDKLVFVMDSIEGLSGPLVGLASLAGAIPEIVIEDNEVDLDNVDEDYVFDNDDDDDDAEYDPSVESNDMKFLFGPEMSVMVDKDDFIAWRHHIYETVGFKQMDVLMEIKTRLGITDLEEELL